jgi:hypothetical protein
VSALPVDATLDQIVNVVLDRGPHLTPAVAAFQAGVEAERARAAAETTEEWGVAHPEDVGDPALVDPFTDQPGAQVWVARMADRGAERVVVRRSVGPWEVQP